MDKIKEVQQILNNHALPTNNGGFIRDSLDGSKFNEIAQDIVKLFAIPAVVGQSEQLVSFLRQYQKTCEIMHVNKIDAKNFVEQYKTN